MQNNQYKLSVLMPLYNSESFVGEALDSILAQKTNYNYKIIIINDASTDNSLSVAKEYQKKHKNIIIIENEKNLKLLKTIFKAYATLDTEYFCVLDPDDYWTDENKLQEAVDFLDKNLDYTIYLTNNEVVANDGTSSMYINADVDNYTFDLNDHMQGRSCLGCTLGSVFRNVVFKNGIPEKIQNHLDNYDCESFRGDSFRNLIHLKEGKAFFKNKSTAVYRYNGDGLWSSLKKSQQNLLNANLYYIFWLLWDKNYSEYFLNNIFKLLNDIDLNFNFEKEEIRTIANMQKELCLHLAISLQGKDQIISKLNAELLKMCNTISANFSKKTNIHNDAEKIKNTEIMSLSVIIPVYNAEKFLRRAIESALFEPEVNEIILVEDCSPDNSLQICEEYSKKYPEKIKLFQHPKKQNLGAGASRNLGIKMATSRYIAFLDADDFYLPGRFTDAMNILNKNNNLDGTYGILGVHFESKEIEQKYNGRFSKPTGIMTYIHPDQLFKALVYGGYGYFSLDTLVVKKELIEKCGYFDVNLRQGQDTHFIYKITLVGKLTSSSLDKIIAMRGVHENNRIHNREKALESHIHIVPFFLNWARKENIKVAEAPILITNFHNPAVNKIIPKYEIVHIMRNDKFNKPFVDFLNKNFDSKKHLILCQRDIEETSANPFPVGENVVEFYDIRENDFSSPKVEKIICHSLFTRGLVEKFYKEPNLLKKAYWVMWGNDLYNAKRDEQHDFVRKNFKGYINDADMDYAIEKYGMKGNFYKAFYNFPITKTMLDSVEENIKSYLQIQINNSCDKSTLEIIDRLNKYKNEKIKILTILSYGDLKYKDEIIKKGTESFGNKFEYIEEMMSPENYAQHLSQNDILILNQSRQQGFGNTLASLYLGKKVFIKKEISVNRYLNNNGIKIFNTNDIINMSFEDFIKFEEKENNINNVQKFFDEKYLASLWKNVFNDE